MEIIILMIYESIGPNRRELITSIELQIKLYIVY